MMTWFLALIGGIVILASRHSPHHSTALLITGAVMALAGLIAETVLDRLDDDVYSQGYHEGWMDAKDVYERPVKLGK